MDANHVKRLLEVANGELPKVEQMYKKLHKDIINLNLKKREGETSILKLNGDIIYLRNTSEHQRLECEKLESEKRSLYLKKIRLESVIKELQNSQEYTKIEIIVKQQLNKVFGNDKQLLKFAFEAIIESFVCSDIRLKTYVMLLAATGFRAVEALSIRIKDLHVETRPAKIFVRGEFTKTKTDRHIFLTEEVAAQLKQWLEYKYRGRRVCHKDNQTEKTITEYRTPERNYNDLVFAVYQDREKPVPSMIYYDLARSFGKTLDRMGRGSREEGNERRRQITLHSFRRFVKTTISDFD